MKTVFVAKVSDDNISRHFEQWQQVKKSVLSVQTGSTLNRLLETKRSDAAVFKASGYSR